MKKIKTPRDAKGPSALHGTPRTRHEVSVTQVPARSARNLRHCHGLRGIRDINRIELKGWEAGVAKMLRGVEKQRFDSANRFFSAMDTINRYLGEARKRQNELQALTEEAQASNEELEATNEEMQATTEELERTSAFRQVLMDSLPDILMTADPQGIITEANPATEQISGYSKAELIGQPFRQFFTDPERAQAGI